MAKTLLEIYKKIIEESDSELEMNHVDTDSKMSDVFKRYGEQKRKKKQNIEDLDPETRRDVETEIHGLVSEMHGKLKHYEFHPEAARVRRAMETALKSLSDKE